MTKAASPSEHESESSGHSGRLGQASGEGGGFFDGEGSGRAIFDFKRVMLTLRETQEYPVLRQSFLHHDHTSCNMAASPCAHRVRSTSL